MEPPAPVLVLNHECLAKTLRETVGENSRCDIGVAAGGERHDHRHRLGRPILRVHGRNCHRGCERKGRRPRQFHFRRCSTINLMMAHCFPPHLFFATATDYQASGAIGIYEYRSTGEWCPGAGSNHRHRDFQSRALPTELPGRRDPAERRACEERGVIEADWRHCPERPPEREFKRISLADRALPAPVFFAARSPRRPSSSSSSLPGTA